VVPLTPCGASGCSGVFHGPEFISTLWQPSGSAATFLAGALGAATRMHQEQTTTRPVNLGYVRVSTLQQDETLQRDAMLDHARPGDTIVVWRLDRLGRSLRHLIELVHELEERGVQLRSLTEQLDTSTPAGRLVFHVFASMARVRGGLDPRADDGRT
jgi:hypothetical protein